MIVALSPTKATLGGGFLANLHFTILTDSVGDPPGSACFWASMIRIH
jgi:hypothetical protein